MHGLSQVLCKPKEALQLVGMSGSSQAHQYNHLGGIGADAIIPYNLTQTGSLLTSNLHWLSLQYK